MSSLRFSRIPGEFAVCQLPSDANLPAWAQPFFSVTRTIDELSIVCLAQQVPIDVKSERGWACFKLEGPFPFTMTGVLASFLQPLAQAQISIFALSTFDTDYVLVKEHAMVAAVEALRHAGHVFIENAA
ncbi:MAG TPA: ACT domain-containing protein [Terriglobales bacterium]|jgi:hypothetical protein